MCTEKQKEEESSNSSSPKHDDSNILLRNVSGLIFIIWFLYLTCAPRIIPGFKCLVYWLLPHGLLYDEKGDINWGTLGDYFGALNCLFAGLAFAAVYVSIRQQSKAIDIQQNELDAQLKEMKDSVRESKEQNGLQREYQFADEFYRRINLLKLIEKDIWFNEKSGQIAALKITSNLNTIIEHIRDGELQKAEAMIMATDGTGLREIVIGLDMFSVWTETFTNTIVWLQEHINQNMEQKKREAESLKDTTLKEIAIADACEDLAQKQKHYEAILLSSTFWASQFLLILQLYKESKLHTIAALLKRYNFQNIARPIPIPDKSYLDLCCNILDLALDNNLTQQIKMIHDSHTSPNG